jgi:hypothetical protein
MLVMMMGADDGGAMIILQGLLWLLSLVSQFGSWQSIQDGRLM